MGISKALVSKYAGKAIKEGWLERDGRNYALVSKAVQALNETLQA